DEQRTIQQLRQDFEGGGRKAEDGGWSGVGFLPLPSFLLPADGFRRLQRPAASKHAQAGEQRPQRRLQQVVTPLIHRSKALMTGRQIPLTTHQQVQLTLQTLQNLAQRQQFRPHHYHLDRQKHSL